MGLVSNDLKNIVDKLGDAKNSINSKYEVMRANNSTSPQEDLDHLFINDLSPSIDKIECLNTYGSDVDPAKVLEGTIVYAKGQAVEGQMKDYGCVSTILHEERATLDMREGHYNESTIKIQVQEKAARPGLGLQIIEPDEECVLSRVFVDGVQVQQKTAIPKKESQDIKPDPEFFLTNVHVEGDDDFIPENIKPGVEIWGVVGAMPTINIHDILDVNKTQTQIPEGYSDGTSEVKIQLQEKGCTPGTTEQVITPDSEHVLSKVTVAGDPDLIPENIKPGVEIFGVVGNMPNNEKYFKLNKSQPTDESPAGYYENKIQAEITDYDIVYVINEKGKVAEVQNVSYGQSFQITNASPVSETGCAFLGWSTDASATSAQYTRNQTVSNNLANRGDTCVLYAVWEPNKPPSAPTLTFTYSNNACVNAAGYETGTITVTPGIDPEGKPVTTTLECIAGNTGDVEISKVSETTYNIKYKKVGPYVFLATSTDPYGLSNSDAGTAMISKQDGSFGGSGDFTTVGSSGVYASEISTFANGCYISDITFEVTVNGSHGADSDEMHVTVWHSDNSSEDIQLFYGNFQGNHLNRVTKTFTLANDIRKIQFHASSPHPECVSSNSTIKWNYNYKFDMSLWTE